MEFAQQLFETKGLERQRALLLSNPLPPSYEEVREAIQYVYHQFGFATPEVVLADSPAQLEAKHWDFMRTMDPHAAVVNYRSVFLNFLNSFEVQAPNSYFRPINVNDFDRFGTGSLGAIRSAGPRVAITPRTINELGVRFVFAFDNVLDVRGRGNRDSTEQGPFPNPFNREYNLNLSTDFVSLFLNPEAAGQSPWVTEIARKLTPLFGYMIVPWSRICFVCPRPTVFVDTRERLHNEEGAAFYWWDGEGEANKGYVWHGVTVSERIIMQPNEITAQDVYNQQNAEVRRAMMYRYGLERLFRDLGAIPVAQDRYGILYKLEFGAGVNWGREVHTFVRVKNGTPEPDGSRREYLLPVPNDQQTPHSAIAWSYARTPEEYNPLQRT